MSQQILTSQEDLSVNWITEHPQAGKEEARYVRRSDDYFIVYLSAQTGCKQACRFCYLTQTGQTKYVDLPIEDIARQADPVLAHYKNVRAHQGKAKKVHYNFMARGEPLANPYLMQDFPALHISLRRKAQALGLEPKFKISTIMPKCADEYDLVKAFGHLPGVGVYYSLYSFDPAFRRRWLPKAMCPYTALDKLAYLQQESPETTIALHGAFIEGENDSLENAQKMIDEVNKRGIRAKFNLVRYNPYSEKQGREAKEESIEDIFQLMNLGLKGENSRIVPRVGFDVKASCGMFV